VPAAQWVCLGESDFVRVNFSVDPNDATGPDASRYVIEEDPIFMPYLFDGSNDLEIFS
jgi:hypothetical protein